MAARPLAVTVAARLDRADDAICYIGIELSARTQNGLLAARSSPSALFAVVALVKVYSGDARRLPPEPRPVQPVDPQPVATISAGMLLGGVHLLGLGHGRRGQRGDRGPSEPPAGRP